MSQTSDCMYWQYTDEGRSWNYPANASPEMRPFHDPSTECGTGFPYSVAASEMDRPSCGYMMDDEQQVKRPMNSFLLWAKVMRKKLAKENPTMHNAQVSKLLGKVWNDMSSIEKRPFIEKAERLRAVHMKEHPNYRYAPKKKKERRSVQKMISPEIAAAFHNAIFDLRSIPSVKTSKQEAGLSQANTLRDLRDSAAVASQIGMAYTSKQCTQDVKHLDLSTTGREYLHGEDLATSLHFQNLFEGQRWDNENNGGFAYATDNGQQFGASAARRWNGCQGDQLSVNCGIGLRQNPIANNPLHSNKIWRNPSPACSDDYSIYPSSPESSLSEDVPSFLQELFENPNAAVDGKMDEKLYLRDLSDIITAELNRPQSSFMSY